jgi:hypothetical protein
MSDSVVVNVLSPEVTNINVNDTGENIYINPLTLNQGIINHSVTHQSGGSDELLHNLLGGLQGGSVNGYYHLTSGQYANLVTGAVVRPSDTGNFITTSQTGAFYPTSNPSGFITGVNLSGYVTGDVVRPSETGSFITASQTGAFYPTSNPSGFISPSQTGAFYAASNPSGFITGVDLSAYVTGEVIRPSQTGAFYPTSNPSGFITGVDLSAYVTGSVVRPSETGDFINFNSLTGDRGDITVTGNSSNSLNFSIDNSAITTAKIANFNITTDKLSSLSVTTNIIATNAVTNTKLADMASQRIKGRISAGTSDPEDLTASQVRTLIDFDHTVSGLLSGYVTGEVVRPSETGAFYAASNPSGFITGVDLSFSGNYYTKNESESRYVNTTGTETILGDKTFHDRVYINNLYVTGLETIVNTTNTNVASNFIMLNLTGGAVDGGLFFVTGSGLTGINDSGAILGFDHSDKFKFGIGTRASDLSVLDTIASVEDMTGISGSLQTQISSLSNATGSYVLNSQTGLFYPTSNPSGFVTGLVVRPSETGSFITADQTGTFYPASNPSGYVTGSVVRPSETGSFITTSQTGAFYPTSNPSGYVTGDVVRPAQTGSFITTEQTGAFYATSNPSGFITGIANIVYTTGNQTIAGLKTFSDNIVGNGTANRLPNQLAVASSDIITKGLADSRYSSRNERITDDTTFLQTIWEQFLDFDDQYNADLTLAAASGGTTFSASPAVFGDVWTASNAGVASFSGNDAHTHRGIFLVRGPTASSQAFYIGVNRTTVPYNLTNRVDEFTCRVFISSTDFTTQGYFKIGIIPKGGTGGADQSLRGGLIFNPFLHPTNLVLGVNKSATASPYTFTTTSANVDFLDTGVNFVNLLDKWVNITYKIDRSGALPVITIIIVRENVVLFQASYNISTDPVVSTWARRADLYLLGASNEIGIQNGKFTYTSRSQLHIDYIYYKVTGTSAAPSNWNSLRF